MKRFSGSLSRKLQEAVVHIGFLVVVLLLRPFPLTSPAIGASISMAGDDVIISAYGETLSLKKSIIGPVDFQWSADCLPEKEIPNLVDWLTKPAIRACFDKTIPDNTDVPYSLTFMLRIMPMVENGKVLPGDVDPHSFPRDALAERSMEMILGSPRATFCTYPTPATPDALGFASGKLRETKFAVNYLFKLPPDRRLAPASRPLCIWCVRQPSLDSACTIELSSERNRFTFLLTWHVPYPPVPKAEWITFDQTARRIAASLLISKPKDFLQ